MTDKSKWFVFKREDGVDVGCFRLKPFNNPEFTNALAMLTMQKSILKSKMSDIKFYQEFMRLISRHIVRDWENVHLVFKDEQDLETDKYTHENAYQLLTSGDISTQIAAWVLDKSKSI